MKTDNDSKLTKPVRNVYNVIRVTTKFGCRKIVKHFIDTEDSNTKATAIQLQHKPRVLILTNILLCIMYVSYIYCSLVARRPINDLTCMKRT